MDIKKRRDAASFLYLRVSVADRLALVDLEEMGRGEEQRRLLGQQRARTRLRRPPSPFGGDRGDTPRRLTRDENIDLFRYTPTREDWQTRYWWGWMELTRDREGY